MDDQLKLVNIVLQRMQKNLECTICLDLLQNPFTTKCGHSFCNECLENLFLQAKGPAKCPLCNASVTKRSLTQNKKIVSFVKAVQKIIFCIKGDFGFAEGAKKSCDTPIPIVCPKTVEPAHNSRVPRKREQTVPFDSQVNMLKRTEINKGTKPRLLAAIDQNESKRKIKEKKENAEIPSVSRVLKDHDKSVEKVKNWLSKSYSIDTNKQLEDEPCSRQQITTNDTAAFCSQQSTVILELSPKKCQPSVVPSLVNEKKDGDDRPTPAFILPTKLAEKPISQMLPAISEGKALYVSAVPIEAATKDASTSKRKLSYETAANKPILKIKKNIRFASEVKTLLLDNSRNAPVAVKRKTKKSPGWTAIDTTKRELRSQVRSLNITGGQEKPMGLLKPELSINRAAQSQDSVILIDEDSQRPTLKCKKFSRPKPKLDNYAVKRKLNIRHRLRPSSILCPDDKLNKTGNVISAATIIPNQNITDVHDISGSGTVVPPVEVCQPFKLLKTTCTKELGSQQNAEEPVESQDKQDQSLITWVGGPPINVQPNGTSRLSSNTRMDSEISKNDNKDAADDHYNPRTVRNSEPSKIATTTCHHVIPCDLFQALKMFIMTQECHEQMGGCVAPATSNTPCETNQYVPLGGSIPPHCPDGTKEKCDIQSVCVSINLPSAPDSLSPVSSVKNGISMECGTSDCNTKPVAVKRDLRGNSEQPQTLAKRDLPASFCSNVNNVEIVAMSNNPPPASAGILDPQSRGIATASRESAKVSSSSKSQAPASDRANRTANLKKNVTAHGSFSRSTAATGSNNLIDIADKNCEIKKHGKRKLKNKDHENKKYKRIKAAETSESSDQESIDYSNSNKVDEKKYNLDSDEWRDFERFDENIMKCFSSPAAPTHRHSDTEEQAAPQPVITSTNDTSNERLDQIGSSDSENEIPCTDEAEPAANVLDKQGSFSLSTLRSTEAALSQSTEDHINKCNESLHRAQKLLGEEVAGQFGDITEDIVNISLSSAISTQSAFISTQKKNVMESEVTKLRAEINALEELKKKKAAGNRALAQKSVTKNVAQCDSIELFCTAPSASLIETEKCSPAAQAPSTKEANKENVNSRSTAPPRKLVSKRNCRNEKIVIVCTGLSAAEVDVTHRFVSTVCDKKSQVMSTWNPSVSHVIVQTNEDGVTERTLKYLYGVATGAWIVSYDWVKDSLKTGSLLKEDTYEALDCTGVAGPRRGRTLLCHVFDGCHLCLVPPFANLTLLQIEEMVSICGADVVQDPNALNDKHGMKLVIVNSADCNEEVDDSKFNGYIGVTYDWLIECVGMASRISLLPYIVGNPKSSQVTKSCIPTALLCETQSIW